MVERECKDCKTSYPLTVDYFNGQQGTGGVLKKICRICQATDQKLRRKLRKDYPAPKDYMCPICLKTKPNWRMDTTFLKDNKQCWKNWCVDHNHRTGEFRGWLCDKCNLMVGRDDEKIEVFERAIKYLKGD